MKPDFSTPSIAAYYCRLINQLNSNLLTLPIF
jgi:hypothetical protein